MAVDLPGTEPHPHARAVLGAALSERGSPSHAYLFQGPAGTGKRAVARAFAAELLADGSRDPASARARAASGAHPDLTWVVPSGAREILTRDVDEPVVAAATRTPFEGARRVFVIEQADTMNDQTANRLLKTLEEPASYVHIVLLTDRPSDVLPTVASRCQPVRFDPLTADQLATGLEADGIEPDRARACARLALGDAGRARRFAFDPGPQLRAAAEALARATRADALGDRPWLELLQLARADGDVAVEAVERAAEEELELTAKRDRRRVRTEANERARRARRRALTGTLDLCLGLTGLWFRDLACVLDGAPELALHADRADELAADAAGADVHRVREAVALVEDTRQRLALNVGEELALEALAYRLAATIGRA